MTGYVHGWPDHLKELYRCVDREEMRIKNLRHHAETCNPDEFDSVMDTLVKVQANLWELRIKFEKARMDYELDDMKLRYGQ